MLKPKLYLYTLTILSFISPATYAWTNYIPTDHCGWYFTLEPFYAKATDTLLTNSIFAVKVADPASLNDFREQYHLDLVGDWGGRLVLGYDFPGCTGSHYSTSLEYTYFNHDNSAFIHNDARNAAGLPVIAPAEFIDITDESSARFSNARTQLTQQYDTLDFLATQNIATCYCSDIKVFGGLRYFHLREKLHNQYDFVGDIGTVRVQNRYDVQFENNADSIGPHIGAGIYYHLIHGFGITGQATGSLLYGESNGEFHNHYQLSPASTLGPVTLLNSSNHHKDAAHVIPAISGKLGLSYQQTFRNCAAIKLEAGYRGDRYFNAANDTAYQQLLAGDDINSNSNYQNFDLTGLYLSLTVKT